MTTKPKAHTKREEDAPDQEPTPQASKDREPTKPATYQTRAQEMLGAYQSQKAEALKREIEEDLEEYVYFYKCDVCQDPAIFFTKNPVDQLITDFDWYATYKDVDQPWADPIVCQSCESVGRETTTPIRFADRRTLPREQQRMNCFRVEGRHQRLLLKRPKDPERALREPSQRAVPYDGKHAHTLQITHPES